MSPRQVRSADVDELVRALQDVEREAAALRDRVRGTALEEGAAEIGGIASALADRARAGALGGGRGALPLSRPFGEWGFGKDATPVWEAIDVVHRVWEERLDRGDFAVDYAKRPND
jgi:hypothetical protein